MEKARFKDCKRIWSFLSKYATKETVKAWQTIEANVNRDVAEIAGEIALQRGKADRDQFETVLNDIIDIEWLDKVEDDQAEDDQVEVEVKQPDQTPSKADQGALDKLLESLGMVLNRDTLDKLKSAVEGEIAGYQEQIDKLLEKVNEFKLPELQPLADDYIKPALFDKVACYMDAGLNTLLIGPAGTGKSRMGREIAAAQGKKCFEMSLGGRMQYAQVIGSTQIKNGDTSFKPAPLLPALGDENTVVILNEIFGLDAEVLLAFNDAFEMDTRFIQTPGGKYPVKATILATANTTGRSVSRQYTGAQRADDSLLSRFSAKIKVHVDEKVEDKLLLQIREKDVRKKIKNKVKRLRERIEETNIPYDAGTRELISCIKNYAAIGDVDQAFEDSFLGGMSKAEKAKLNIN